MDGCLRCKMSDRKCTKCELPICDAHTDSQYDLCLWFVSNYILFDHDRELEAHSDTGSTLSID